MNSFSNGVTMTDTLDLAILNRDLRQPAIVYVRCAHDLAMAHLPLDDTLKELVDFGLEIEAAVKGERPRPDERALEAYGNKLFCYIIRDDVKRLYDGPPTHGIVRLHLISDRSDLQAVPWEYMQDPLQGAGPNIRRSIVRIVPMIGVPPPEPVSLSGAGRKLKVLLAYADPLDQEPLSWPDVKARIEQGLAPEALKGGFELKLVEATPEALVQALQAEQFDVFHFVGHGEVEGGVGHLLLLNGQNNGTIRFPAKRLGMLIRGRGMKVSILSACRTAFGRHAQPFANIADVLVREGVPAVVANQLYITNSAVVRFVGPLYTALVTSGDIDRAVSEGRVALATALESPDEAPLEWGVPTLYRHIGAAKVFTV